VMKPGGGKSKAAPKQEKSAPKQEDPDSDADVDVDEPAPRGKAERQVSKQEIELQTLDDKKTDLENKLTESKAAVAEARTASNSPQGVEVDENMPHYAFSGISREDADGKLAHKNDGTFLVRAQPGGKYYLCCMFRGKATHHSLTLGDTGYYVINEKPMGEGTSVTQTINHMRKKLKNWPVLLTHGIPNPEIQAPKKKDYSKIVFELNAEVSSLERELRGLSSRREILAQVVAGQIKKFEDGQSLPASQVQTGASRKAPTFNPLSNPRINETNIDTAHNDSGYLDVGGDDDTQAAPKERKKFVSLSRLVRPSETIVDDMNLIANQFAAKLQFEKVSISNEPINGVKAQVLYQMLAAEDSMITELRLVGNDLTRSTLSGIAKAIANNRTLTALQISSNGVDDECARVFGDCLQCNVGLRMFSLRDNFVSDLGAKYLGGSLKVNQTLESLSLRGNNISNTGIELLIESLETNKTLNSMILYDNPFRGAKGFIQMANKFSNCLLKITPP